MTVEANQPLDPSKGQGFRTCPKCGRFHHVTSACIGPSAVMHADIGTSATTEATAREATPQELLPCPFCGARPDSPYTNNVGETYARLRHEEGCCMSLGTVPREHWIPGAAFQAWNTRPYSATKARVERLEAALRGCYEAMLTVSGHTSDEFDEAGEAARVALAKE